MADRLAKMEGERTTSIRKQQLSTIYAKLPEQLRKPYERISVDSLSDEEFTTLITEVTTEVDGLAKDINAKGAVFGRPTQTTGSQENGTLSKEQQEAIAHRDTVVTDGKGQPF